MNKPTVAVLKVTPETVLGSVARACELAGARAALAAGRSTLLEEELSWRFPFPAANTTPWQLEGAVLALRAAGLPDVRCLRPEAAMARALEGADPNHVGALCDRHGVGVLHAFRDEEVRWVEYRPKARLRALGKVFPEGVHVPDVVFGKNVVSLPTIKTHVFSTVAGAMKTAFASTLPRERHRATGRLHEAMVDVLAIQREITSGLFAVMDGTTAGSGPGPRTTTPEVKDFVLASADPVALDAVAAKMMGFDPMGVPFIRMAHEDRLGVGDPRDIDVVGADVSRESWGFRVGASGASAVGNLLWGGPLEPLQKAVLRGPLTSALAAGSEAYHALYRWPLKDRRTFENWRRETAWGRLFSAYERGESDRVTQRASAEAERESAHTGHTDPAQAQV
jgi:uncharacterized protein (DUF362 family)